MPTEYALITKECVHACASLSHGETQGGGERTRERGKEKKGGKKKSQRRADAKAQWLYKIILSFSYDLHNSQVEENKAVIYAVLPSKLKKVIFTAPYIDFIFRTLSKTSGEFNPTL